MGFTITCNKCNNKQTANNEPIRGMDGVDVGVTEDRTIVGTTVETIDFMCWKCNQEVNIPV